MHRPAPWQTQALVLDHILPDAVAPELAARFFDLDALPAKENQAKAARIGRREVEIAHRWHREGLLSAAGMRAVETEAEMTTSVSWLGRLTSSTSRTA